MLEQMESLPDAVRRTTHVLMVTAVALALLVIMGAAATCAATIANNRSASAITYQMCSSNTGARNLGSSQEMSESVLLHC